MQNILSVSHYENTLQQGIILETLNCKQTNEHMYIIFQCNRCITLNSEELSKQIINTVGIKRPLRLPESQKTGLVFFRHH